MRTAVRAAAVALCACSHEAAYAPETTVADNPPVPVGNTQQLTFSSNGDWGPQFIDNGLRVAFAWRDPLAADHDRCLVEVPLTSRRIDVRICPGGPGQPDTTNTVWTYAFSGTGQVAYVVTEGRIGFTSSDRFLVVAKSDGSAPRRAITFPVALPDSTVHNDAIDLAWLDDSTLVYLASTVTTSTIFPFDTVETPLQAMRVDLRPATPTFSRIPNTRDLSAIAWDPATHILYGATGSDTVYTIDPVTGQKAAVGRFGIYGQPREMAINNGRMVAVVRGGARSRAGELAVLDLPGSSPALVPTPHAILDGYFYRRPSISPQHDRGIL